MADVVKTRMQLETGKSSLGLVGSLRSIVAQEGYVVFSQSD
jgi:solute carrier family 25 (mitochondrial 2-oxodicarboxylate transporter), member 21